MKILIIRFSSIGDIVLTTPVVRAAKLQLGAEVHFLTKKAYAGMLGANPYIDRIHGLDEDFSKLMQVLRRERFDLIVDLHHNLRTLRVKNALRRPSRSFYKANIEKWLMVRFKYDRLPKTHIIDRYMATLEDFGVKADGLGMDYYYREVPDLLARWEITEPFVAIALGAAHRTKQIPVSLVEKLICARPGKYVLIGGKDVASSGKELASRNPEVIDLCGRLSLDASAQVIESSDCLVTGDTGMMHIGAALKKPMLSVWGNTIPAFGMYPYYGSENKIEHEEFEQLIKCRPCSKTGFKKCPKGHFRCMLDHDAMMISNALNRLIEK